MDVDGEDKKAKDGSTNEEEEDDDGEDDYEFKWLDKGKRRHGRREYESVLLTLHETSFRVSKNDFVLLWGIHGDENDTEREQEVYNQSIEEIWQSAGCAKVQAMWEEPNEDGKGSKAMFQARWFFQVSQCVIFVLNCSKRMAVFLDCFGFVPDSLTLDIVPDLFSEARP